MPSLELQELNEIYQKLPTAYGIIKPDSPIFTIISANRSYRKLLHPSGKDIKGKSFSEIASKHIVEHNDLNNVNLQEALEAVIKNGSDNQTEIVQLRRGKANSRYCTFKHVPITSDDGNLKYIVQTIEDVTDKLTPKEKQTSQTQEISSRSQLHIQNETLTNQINKKIAQYESARKELNDFIYSVSHDLRAPLRRIDGFSQELINEYIDQLDDMGAHYLKRVRQGAQDMGNLIDDLLKLSRISQRSVDIQSLNLTKLAKAVFEELIELEPERDVKFTAENNLITQADHGLAKVMLTNLISNALKFTSKEKTAIIELGVEKQDNGSYFYIKDNGVGFDPEYSEKLFKAFDRLHSQKEFQGSGIGLATVKRIVNLHGGDIWAESTPDQGATFYFMFQETQ